jgi:Nicotinamide mononucleotide transporter
MYSGACVRAAKLYADAALQVLFFALGVYGWWLWSAGRAARTSALRVRRTTRHEWAWLSALTSVATAAVATGLALHTDSPVPLWDASVLTLSLAATYRGQYSAEVDALAKPPARRLYLLTHPDNVPFEQDGIRDGEDIRSWMTHEFKARLAAGGYTWHWLRGPTRMERALSLFERVQSG